MIPRTIRQRKKHAQNRKRLLMPCDGSEEAETTFGPIFIPFLCQSHYQCGLAVLASTNFGFLRIGLIFHEKLD